MAIVYKATNLINGDYYIGCTKNGLEERRINHISRSKAFVANGCKFIKALAKFGADNFRWSILAEGMSHRSALALEKALIKKLQPEYNSVYARYSGQNNQPIKIMCLNTGEIFTSLADAGRAIGAHPSELSTAIYTARKCEGLRFVLFDKRMTRKQRLNLIKVLDEQQVERRQKVQRPRTIRKSGTDVSGRSDAGPMSLARAVKCIDDGKQYESASAAAAAYGAPKSAIIELCLGRRNRKTVRGQRFCYIDSVH